MVFISESVPEGISAHRIKTVRGRYDFAVDGGAIGTIALVGDVAIPSGVTIMGGFLNVDVPLASLGLATVALQANAAADVLGATAFDNAVFSSAGVKSINPGFTGATMIRTTAARDISAVVGGANLTAGKFDVFLFYIDPVA